MMRRVLRRWRRCRCWSGVALRGDRVRGWGICNILDPTACFRVLCVSCSFIYKIYKIDPITQSKSPILE